MVLEKVTEVIVKTVHCKSEDVKLETELITLGVDSLRALTVYCLNLKKRLILKSQMS